MFSNGALAVPTPHNKKWCHPVAEDNPFAPPREGLVWEDSEDQLEYRWVQPGTLKLEHGWLPVPAWLKKLGVQLPMLRALVQAGMFDAAIERGTPHRCLRCKDIDRVWATLQLNKRKPGRPRKLVLA